MSLVVAAVSSSQLGGRKLQTIGKEAPDSYLKRFSTALKSLLGLLKHFQGGSCFLLRSFASQPNVELAVPCRSEIGLPGAILLPEPQAKSEWKALDYKREQGAVRAGFPGTYDEWVVHRAKKHRRLGGMFSLLSLWWNHCNKLHTGTFTTLVLDKALAADQFFHFRPTETPGQVWREVARQLVFNGRRLGRANIKLPPGEDVWLCPYFEPNTQTLRFRRRDGRDAEAYFDLYDLSKMKCARSLLEMALAEGLLDKIPGKVRLDRSRCNYH